MILGNIFIIDPFLAEYSSQYFTNYYYYYYYYYYLLFYFILFFLTIRLEMFEFKVNV